VVTVLSGGFMSREEKFTPENGGFTPLHDLTLDFTTVLAF
jgi:hypothetical protein